MEEALRAAGVADDVKEYPEAGHAFLNDHEGAGDKEPLKFLPLKNTGYRRAEVNCASAVCVVQSTSVDGTLNQRAAPMWSRT